MLQNLTGSEQMSYSNTSLTAGGTNLNVTNCWDYYYHYIPTWYPTYHYCEKSKVEQAFKIVGELMEQKIIDKDLTVKEFMKLVNKIADII